MKNEYNTYVVWVWPYDPIRQIQKIVVENPLTGSKVSFKDLDGLVAFLKIKSASSGGGPQGSLDPTLAEGTLAEGLESW
jgi:hypothetical protein